MTGKTPGKTTTDYYFDGGDLIIEAQGSSIVAYYTQGQGLISQRQGNASYFYHYDGLGSIKALTDANQNIQASYKYDAWGNILQTSGTITNPYLYVGELGYYGDGDAGMYLLTQRWYNPVVGRFVVRDPLIRNGKNFYFNDVYLYAENVPVSLTDPSGLVTYNFCRKWWKECLEDAGREFSKCLYEVAFGSWKEAVPEEVANLLACGAGCASLCAETGPAFVHCTFGCMKACDIVINGIKYLFAYAACQWILYRQKRECDEAYKWCCEIATKRNLSWEKR